MNKDKERDIDGVDMDLHAGGGKKNTMGRAVLLSA